MRTTVDLPDPLFKRVKAEAALRGMKLRDFIARSLEQALSGGSRESRSRRVKLPLVKGEGKRRIDPTREDSMPVSGTRLVDANVWLALAFSDHAHHNVAVSWFGGLGEGGGAFCAITQKAPSSSCPYSPIVFPSPPGALSRRVRR